MAVTHCYRRYGAQYGRYDIGSFYPMLCEILIFSCLRLPTFALRLLCSRNPDIAIDTVFRSMLSTSGFSILCYQSHALSTSGGLQLMFKVLGKIPSTRPNLDWNDALLKPYYGMVFVTLNNSRLPVLPSSSTVAAVLFPS